MMASSQERSTKKDRAKPTKSPLSFVLTNMIIIHHSSLDINNLNQKNYTSVVYEICDSQEFRSLFPFFIFYGSYQRSFIDHAGNLQVIHIIRILDKTSGKTHALFPDCLVPYQRLPLESQLNIIHAEGSDEVKELSRAYLIDMPWIQRIIKRSLPFRISIPEWQLFSVEQLITTSLKQLHRTFMMSERMLTIIQFPTLFPT